MSFNQQGNKHAVSLNGRCGFATGIHDEVKQPGSNDMTIVQSKAFFERLQADESFRNSVLGAENMNECMRIVELNGFDCSTDEVRMTLDRLAAYESPDSCENFTLWGNRIPG